LEQDELVDNHNFTLPVQEGSTWSFLSGVSVRTYNGQGLPLVQSTGGWISGNTFFSCHPNQEIGQPFLFEDHKIGTCPQFGADSTTNKFTDEWVFQAVPRMALNS
jgi:hypothetical protein